MPSLSSWSALLLLPAAISAVTFDCGRIRADGESFDFSKLGGPKDVHQLKRTPPSITNTTYTIDICNKLDRDPEVDKKLQCADGTRICAVERDYSPSSEEPIISKVKEIAGNYAISNGRHLEPSSKQFHHAENGDKPERKGVIVELHGGLWDGTKQKAIIEFVCDKEWDGTEGFGKPNTAAFVDAAHYGRMVTRDSGESGDDNGDGSEGDEEPTLPNWDEGKALQFKDYSTSGNVATLKLEWKTKWACVGQASNGDDDKPDDDTKSRGWGFFTWFLIVAFLLIAAYIIFGSWLNYNRYGARGWDLIPHGDAIRELPWTLKEWTTTLLGKIRAPGGSRGGYSAV